MATKFPPVANVGSQIERAVIALLMDAYGDEQDNYNYYFSNDWKMRDAPLIDVLALRSTEYVPHTRVEAYVVRIEWKWKGNNIAGEANPDTNWRSINDFVGVGMEALSQSDNGADYSYTAQEITRLGRALATADPTNHADMADFTCEWVQFRGSHRAESDGQNFFIKEIREFEIRACPANVD